MPDVVDLPWENPAVIPHSTLFTAAKPCAFLVFWYIILILPDLTRENATRSSIKEGAGTRHTWGNWVGNAVEIWHWHQCISDPGGHRIGREDALR